MRASPLVAAGLAALALAGHGVAETPAAQQLEASARRPDSSLRLPLPGQEDALGPPPLYEELRQARVEAAGHIRDSQIRIDRLGFELTEGELYLLTPVAGRVTGAVFLGTGRVRLQPPDAVERHQFEKLLDEECLDESFSQAVFRFSDDTDTRLRALTEPAVKADVDKANKIFEKRRKEIFKERSANPDSRILADLLNVRVDSIPAENKLRPQPALRPRSGYFHAEIKSKKHDWFCVEIEPLKREEVQVFQFHQRQNLKDTWASFNALSDYGSRTFEAPIIDSAPRRNAAHSDEEESSPALPQRPPLPEHEGWSQEAAMPLVTVDLAIDGNGKAKGSAEIVIEALRPLAGVRLRLSTLLEVTDVRWPASNDNSSSDPMRVGWPDKLSRESGPFPPADPSEPLPASGKPLHFVQERNRRGFSEDRYEPRVTVQLPRTVPAGESFSLQLGYKGKLIQRLQSGAFFLRDTQYWYPQHPQARRSKFRMTFRTPKRYRVASGGRLIEDRVVGKTRIARRLVEQPLRSMSFQFGRFKIVDIDPESFDSNRTDPQRVPPITIYSNKDSLGFAPGNREKTINDLTTSLSLYGDYFGPFPFYSLVVTETPALSGQAFGGLLLLSFQTFGELHTGEAELFRAHEVAHQWWGAAIDWESYRDQWLSEGFAQYAAALFVLLGLEKEDQFRAMMDAWLRDVLGKVDVGQGLGMRHYGFRPQIISKSDGSDSGALVLGRRLSSKKTPFDYRLLVYEKGAYILHMLRMMLTNLESGDDTRFRRLMRGFADEYRGKTANTDGFEQAVAEAFDEPMDWFFDQWVYGVEVPTYKPNLRVVKLAEGETPYALRGEIIQENVADGFRMPVPIMLTFENRPPMVLRVWVDAERVEVDQPLPAHPTKVEFNYLDSVLAWIK